MFPSGGSKIQTGPPVLSIFISAKFHTNTWLDLKFYNENETNFFLVIQKVSTTAFAREVQYVSSSSDSLDMKSSKNNYTTLFSDKGSLDEEPYC